MRSRANLPIFAAYATICIVVLGFLAAQMGGEFLLQRVYHVAATFATGAELVGGDDVTINGLRVGRVGSIEPVANGARAVLELHDQYAPLYADARAMVKSKNLLGETYVELNRGTPQAGPLPDGGQIDLQHTLTPVELDQVLNVLDADTRQRLVLLINELGEAVQGRGQDLNAYSGDLRVVAESLQSIAHAVATQSDHLDSLLTDLRKVLETIASYRTELRALIGDWDRLMRTLASRESDLEGLIVQEDRVVTILDQALAGNNAQGLHDAIAEAPRTLDNADHYLSNSQIVFGDLAAESPDIADVFTRLASVMSGTDPQGNHMWRIYIVGSTGDVSVPCNPSPPAGGGGASAPVGVLVGNTCSGPPPPSPFPVPTVSPTPGGGR